MENDKLVVYFSLSCLGIFPYDLILLSIEAQYPFLIVDPYDRSRIHP